MQTDLNVRHAEAEFLALEIMAYKVKKNKNGVPRKKPKKRRIKKGEKGVRRGRDGKIRRKK